jgi:hypothetical protein
MAVERLTQQSHPWPAAHPVESQAKLVGIGQTKLVGLVDRSLELPAFELVGDIDESADRDS